MTNDLESTRPVDCTEDPGVPDDTMPTMNGMAMQKWGVPYGDLTRRKQRMIKAVYDGHRKEIEACIKSIGQNNLLSAKQRVDRIGDYMDQLASLTGVVMKDVAELVEHDDMGAQEADLKKTNVGSAKVRLRLLDTAARLVKTQVEAQATVAKMEQQTADKNTVVLNQDNRSVNVSAEDVAAQLQAAIKGELVDQSGDGDGSGHSEHD